MSASVADEVPERLVECCPLDRGDIVKLFTCGSLVYDERHVVDLTRLTDVIRKCR